MRLEYRLPIITMLIGISLPIFGAYVQAEEGEGYETEYQDGREYEASEIQSVTPKSDSLESASPIIKAPQAVIKAETENERSSEAGDVGQAAGLFALPKELVDSDRDGMPDLEDAHPGEDDFAYRLIDNNLNGVDDELESLIK